MNPTEALKHLGSSRVIWIDDHFEVNSPAQIAELLGLHIEVSRNAGFTEFEDLFARIDDDDDDARAELIERLTGLSPSDRLGLKRRFNENEDAKANGGTQDLTQGQIDTVCAQLSIEETDRWSFNGAEKKIMALCEEDDSHISYIIDLNDAYGSLGNTRGLDLLKTLHAGKSKSTAFLLTHEASRDTEANREQSLREALTIDGAYRESPICVIAKERLEGEPIDAVVSEGLRIAIKRAGLRRSVHEVLMQAEGEVKSAYDNAMKALLQVPPEQLDEYVVGRAYAEGVSELHVVERALTASMSESLRRLFATGEKALQSAQRLRALQSVPLTSLSAAPNRELEEFRKKELWEPGELVNISLSPLACGDVFEFDSDESEQDATRMFVLIVQPCDITLRPKGERDADAGFFIPLKLPTAIKESTQSSPKQPPLPFLLDGKQWYCDFRSATSVRLEILDLATLRVDGKVRYEANSTLPGALLPGQERNGKSVHRKLESAMTVKLNERKGATNKFTFDSRCQLTLSSAGPFQKIASATYIEAITASEHVNAVCARFTWKIRRAGRVRMPYAAALLSNYLAVMDREAFDLDYLRSSAKSDKNELEGTLNLEPAPFIPEAPIAIPTVHRAYSEQSPQDVISKKPSLWDGLLRLLRLKIIT